MSRLDKPLMIAAAPVPRWGGGFVSGRAIAPKKRPKITWLNRERTRTFAGVASENS
jgi:hypothetical protein